MTNLLLSWNKGILQSSAAWNEESKYEIPMASSKENSVVFNIHNHKNRDIINDTHTDLSEKLRLEYLESNESSLMIKNSNMNYKSSTQNWTNFAKVYSFLQKDKVGDFDFNSSHNILNDGEK